MTPEEEKIKFEAQEFAKRHRKKIAKELTDTSKFIPEQIPFSVFMAGSPGAGKTEYSRNLIEGLERDLQRKVIRIDGDEFRKGIPGYNGKNSYLFNGAVSLIVEKIHDFTLNNKQTFLLDGTFSNYDKAIKNINRSLNKKRFVIIFYVYQHPDVAWKFTQAREASEGRNIPKGAFIEQFIQSRNTVEHVRSEFDEKVSLFLVIKNFETHKVENVVEINRDNKQIDYYIEKRYTRDELEKLL